MAEAVAGGLPAARRVRGDRTAGGSAARDAGSAAGECVDVGGRSCARCSPWTSVTAPLRWAPAAPGDVPGGERPRGLIERLGLVRLPPSAEPARSPR